VFHEDTSKIQVSQGGQHGLERMLAESGKMVFGDLGWRRGKSEQEKPILKPGVKDVLGSELLRSFFGEKAPQTHGARETEGLLEA